MDSKLLNLSEDDRKELDHRLADFAKTWSPQAFNSQVETLPPNDHPLRRPLLEGMVRIDLEMRWQRGESARLEEYLHRFPELGGANAVSVKLILAEFQARQRFGKRSEAKRDGDHGSSQNLRELAKRFPDQAADLRNLAKPKSTDEDSSVHLGATDLSSSGSSFSTSDDDTSDDEIRLPEHFGRYHIQKRLGIGGMGAVFLAQDTRLDRQVALKVPRLFANKDEDPSNSRYDDITENLERFYREARAAATIHHPNLCPVYDVGEIDGLPYLTMAFIEGWPLSRFAKPGKQLSQIAVAATLRKIALAIYEAHKLGILHRDLKPSNVMVNKRGEPIVMDFGLACWLQNDAQDQRLTRTGAILGAPVYMSPEQVYGDNEAMGPASDLYSLGVILYELLTGRLPFEGPNVTATLAQTLMLEPKKPSEHRPNLDPELEAICITAMAKKAEDRYADMKEFANVLGEYIREARGGESPSSTKNLGTTKRKGQRPARERGDAFVESAPSSPAKRKSAQGITHEPSTKAKLDKIHAPPPPLRRVPVWCWAVLLLLVMSGIGAGVWFFLVSGEGTVRIVIKPPFAVVDIQIDGVTYDRERLEQEISLATGEHLLEISGANFKPVKRNFAIAGGENAPIEIQLEFSRTGPSRPKTPEFTEPLRILDPRGPTLTRLAVSPTAFRGYPGTSFRDRDVRLAAVGVDGAVRLWDLQNERSYPPIRAHKGAAEFVQFSPDGQQILSCGDDKTLRLFDVGTRKQIRVFNGHTQKVWTGVFSPDGKQILSGSADRKAIVWDVATGKKIHTFVGHDQPINGVAISPDGTLGLSAGWDGVLQLLELKSGKTLKRLHQQKGLTSVDFHPQNKNLALTGGQDGVVRLWNLNEESVAREYLGHDQSVWSVAFSPGGRRIVSGDAEGKVVLHDVQSGDEICYLVGHGKQGVPSVLFTPDGAKVLTCGKDRTIREWELPRNVYDPPPLPSDLAVSKQTQLLQGHTASVEAVAFLPSLPVPAGQPVLRRAISCGHDKEPILWNLDTGEEIRRFRGHTAAVHDVLVTKDGSHAVTAGWDGTVRVWNVETGKETQKFAGHKGKVQSVALSPNETFLATGGADKKVIVWNFVNGREAQRFTAHTQAVWSLEFSADGSMLVSAGQGGRVCFWNINRLTRIGEWRNNKGLHAVAVSPTGTHIVAGGVDHRIYLIDRRTRTKIAEFVGHTDLVTGLKFSPDGRWVLSTSDDHTVRVWDVEIGQEVARYTGHTKPVWGTDISADGRFALSASADKTVRLWSLPAYMVKLPVGSVTTLRETTRLARIAVSPNGKIAIVGDLNGSVSWWDLDTRKQLGKSKAHTKSVHFVAFGPRGRHAVSTGVDGLIKLWKVETREEIRTLKGHDSPVWCAQFVPNGYQIVSGDEKGNVYVWSVRTGELLHSLDGHTQRVNSLAVGPNKRLLTASLDGTVRLWDLSQTEILVTLEGHTEGVTTCAFTPDGRHAISGSFDKTVRLWDLETGEAKVFKGHSGQVWFVDVSLDGRWIVSSGAERVIRVWDLQAEKPLRVYRGHKGSIPGVLFHSDGRRLISCSRDNTVRIWGLPVR